MLSDVFTRTFALMTVAEKALQTINDTHCAVRLLVSLIARKKHSRLDENDIHIY